MSPFTRRCLKRLIAIQWATDGRMRCLERYAKTGSYSEVSCAKDLAIDVFDLIHAMQDVENDGKRTFHPRDSRELSNALLFSKVYKS